MLANPNPYLKLSKINNNAQFFYPIQYYQVYKLLVLLFQNSFNHNFHKPNPVVACPPLSLPTLLSRYAYAKNVLASNDHEERIKENMRIANCDEHLEYRFITYVQENMLYQDGEQQRHHG